MALYPHLILLQGFRNKDEVQRFSDMMEEMCYIVATKHSGSLKGEHGTGRNVAPFVEMEWGSKVWRWNGDQRWAEPLAALVGAFVFLSIATSFPSSLLGG